MLSDEAPFVVAIVRLSIDEVVDCLVILEVSDGKEDLRGVKSARVTADIAMKAAMNVNVDGVCTGAGLFSLEDIKMR